MMALPASESACLSNVWKSYGVDYPALCAVDFDVRAGEIHALIGENGAGKSTLMQVLSGVISPDRGALSLAGKQTSFRDWTPRMARRAGIAMVHQQSNLVPRLTVAENLYFAQGSFWFNSREATRRVDALVRRFGFEVDGNATVESLSVGERQRVEILRALDRGARVLILDEPTASLALEEVDRLFGILRKLSREGCGVVFISHKFEEIREIADRVTVLRGGRKVVTVDTAEADVGTLGRLMLGRDAPVLTRNPGLSRINGPALSLCDLSTDGYREQSRLKGVNLVINHGEVVGIAGIEGNGQLELEEVLAGVRAIVSGRLEVSGRSVVPDIRTLRNLGVAQLSGNRFRAGLIPGMSVAENLIAKSSYDDRRIFRWLRIDHVAARARATEVIGRFGIRPAHPDVDVASLSGGNAQKVAVARELEGARSVLVAFNPTRGLDVASAHIVHRQLLATRDQGGAVLVVSSNIDELMALVDRIFILVEGVLREVPTGADLVSIGAAMLGEDVW